MIDDAYERWHRENPKAQDRRPAEEIIARALAERSFEARWELVSTLHFRTDRETLEAARRLCFAKSAKERVLGADILGQLGIRYDPFRDERVDILVGLLEDHRVTVLQAAASALGHMFEPRAAEPLSGLKGHPNKDVRWSVVFGLLGVEHPAAISTLLELMEDPDSDVRDWATMGIGSMIDEDTPKIREALFRHLEDPDEDTAGEAMVGLARRKDPRAFEPLRRWLEQGIAGSLTLEAAEELGDPRLYDILVSLKETGDADTPRLDRAIESCRPKGPHA